MGQATDPSNATPAIRDGRDGRAASTPDAARSRRLVASERYFGLDARLFRAGAERMLARLATMPAQAPVDRSTIARDFAVDVDTATTVLQSLVASQLLQPDAQGRYRPTRRFEEYARATVVAPLSRARAKALIHHACRIVAEINATWTRNPYWIDMVAVSGSYMSRRREMPELTLWLVMRKRASARTRRWGAQPDRGEAVREIAKTITALSSFITLRVAGDRDAIERPFSVVFKVADDTPDTTSQTWQRLRGWSASIGRKLSSRQQRAGSG